MDHFLSTYQKDYKWPVLRSCADDKKLENLQEVLEVQLQDADPCGKGEIKAPVVAGQVGPAQCGAPPQGEGSTSDQPNAYLRKLYTKYPYLYNVMKLTSPKQMLDKVMKEKYKSVYETDYNKEGFYPADDFTTMMDIIDATKDAEETPTKCDDKICTPGGEAPSKCKCSQGLAYVPCRCMTQESTRKPAWKPPPKSKIPRPPAEEKKKKKKEEGEEQKKDKDVHVKVRPFVTEYNDTISKVGGIIIKHKLHHPKPDPAEVEAKKRVKK